MMTEFILVFLPLIDVLICGGVTNGNACMSENLVRLHELCAIICRYRCKSILRNQLLITSFTCKVHYSLWNTLISILQITKLFRPTFVSKCIPKNTFPTSSNINEVYIRVLFKLLITRHVLILNYNQLSSNKKIEKGVWCQNTTTSGYLKSSSYQHAQL